MRAKDYDMPIHFRIHNSPILCIMSHFLDCLNFLIHIDLDMDAIPFPLDDRHVYS